MIEVTDVSNIKKSVSIGNFAMQFMKDDSGMSLLADNEMLVHSEEIDFKYIPEALRKLADIVDEYVEKPKQKRVRKVKAGEDISGV